MGTVTPQGSAAMAEAALPHLLLQPSQYPTSGAASASCSRPAFLSLRRPHHGSTKGRCPHVPCALVHPTKPTSDTPSPLDLWGEQCCPRNSWSRVSRWPFFTHRALRKAHHGSHFSQQSHHQKHPSLGLPPSMPHPQSSVRHKSHLSSTPLYDFGSFHCFMIICSKEDRSHI